jgi:hypothetical protein
MSYLESTNIDTDHQQENITIPTFRALTDGDDDVMAIPVIW